MENEIRSEILNQQFEKLYVHCPYEESYVTEISESLRATDPSSVTMKNKLEKLYGLFWNDIKRARRFLATLTSIHLVSPSEVYENAGFRVLFVGIEGRGWIKPHQWPKERMNGRVNSLMRIYDQSILCRTASGSNEGFPSPLRELLTRIRAVHENAECAISCAWAFEQYPHVRSPSRPDFMYARQMAVQIMLDEIRILEPDIVVFLTGSEFDRRLKAVCPTADISSVDALCCDHLSKIECRRIHAPLVFRTCDPEILECDPELKMSIFEAITTKLASKQRNEC